MKTKTRSTSFVFLLTKCYFRSNQLFKKKIKENCPQKDRMTMILLTIRKCSRTRTWSVDCTGEAIYQQSGKLFSFRLADSHWQARDKTAVASSISMRILTFLNKNRCIAPSSKQSWGSNNSTNLQVLHLIAEVIIIVVKLHFALIKNIVRFLLDCACDLVKPRSKAFDTLHLGLWQSGECLQMVQERYHLQIKKSGHAQVKLNSWNLLFSTMQLYSLLKVLDPKVLGSVSQRVRNITCTQRPGLEALRHLGI